MTSPQQKTLFPPPLNRLLLLPLIRGEDFFDEVRRNLLVMAELDVEVRPAPGYGAEVAGMSGHDGFRSFTL